MSKIDVDEFRLDGDHRTLEVLRALDALIETVNLKGSELDPLALLSGVKALPRYTSIVLDKLSDLYTTKVATRYFDRADHQSSSNSVQ